MSTPPSDYLTISGGNDRINSLSTITSAADKLRRWIVSVITSSGQNAHVVGNLPRLTVSAAERLVGIPDIQRGTQVRRHMSCLVPADTDVDVHCNTLDTQTTMCALLNEEFDTEHITGQGPEESPTSITLQVRPKRQLVSTLVSIRVNITVGYFPDFSRDRLTFGPSGTMDDFQVLDPENILIDRGTPLQTSISRSIELGRILEEIIEQETRIIVLPIRLMGSSSHTSWMIRPGESIESAWYRYSDRLILRIGRILMEGWKITNLLSPLILWAGDRVCLEECGHKVNAKGLFFDPKSKDDTLMYRCSECNHIMGLIGSVHVHDVASTSGISWSY